MQEGGQDMAVSEQSKKENKQKNTLLVLSVILVISVFLNIYQLFYIKQIETSFETLEQRYIELLEDVQLDN